jgi:hypothetical protein
VRMESTDRSIAAEARGVEENHHARLGHDQDGIYVRVASDSVPGRWYRVTAHATAGQDGDITFTCKPNDLHQPGRRRDHGLKCSNDGTTPCKHMTRAARRLERAGLVRWVDPHVDQGIAYVGRWVAARATGPVVTDDLEEAEDVPAIAAGVALAVLRGDLVPTESGSLRRASDSQGYRATMAAIAPTAGDPFASFPRY